jgi:hypothetical protein
LVFSMPHFCAPAEGHDKVATIRHPRDLSTAQ